MSDRNPTPPVNARYGAPLGRHSTPPDERTRVALYLRRVPLNADGYDSGGAYWGVRPAGQSLWWYCSAEFEESFARGYLDAAGMADAKAKLRAMAPNVTFKGGAICE